MLKISQLTARRGATTEPLFTDLSFTVTPGQCWVITGPNGTGKTTLLRTLCGLSQPDSGEITWDGQSINTDRENYHRQLLYIGHRPSLTASLTVLENLQTQTAFYGQSHTQQELEQALADHDLAHIAHRYGRDLSAGQGRRVALLKTQLIPAKFWVLDEPFTGLDEAACTALEARLDEHLQAGGMVVLTSHQGRAWLTQSTDNTHKKSLPL